MLICIQQSPSTVVSVGNVYVWGSVCLRPHFAYFIYIVKGNLHLFLRWRSLLRGLLVCPLAFGWGPNSSMQCHYNICWVYYLYLSTFSLPVPHVYLFLNKYAFICPRASVLDNLKCVAPGSMFFSAGLYFIKADAIYCTWYSTWRNHIYATCRVP